MAGWLLVGWLAAGRLGGWLAAGWLLVGWLRWTIQGTGPGGGFALVLAPHPGLREQGQVVVLPWFSAAVASKTFWA